MQCVIVRMVDRIQDLLEAALLLVVLKHPRTAKRMRFNGRAAAEGFRHRRSQNS